jgi:hypothetical protein
MPEMKTGTGFRSQFGQRRHRERDEKAHGKRLCSQKKRAKSVTQISDNLIKWPQPDCRAIPFFLHIRAAKLDPRSPSGPLGSLRSVVAYTNRYETATLFRYRRRSVRNAAARPIRTEAETKVERSCPLRRCIEDGIDDRGHLRPLGRLGFQLTTARRRKAIEFSAALVFRFTPLAFQPSLMFDPVESDVKGTLRNLKTSARDLLDAHQYAVAMKRTQRNSFENQYLQGSLEEFNGFFHARSPINNRRVRASLFARQAAYRIDLPCPLHPMKFWQNANCVQLQTVGTFLYPQITSN